MPSTLFSFVLFTALSGSLASAASFSFNGGFQNDSDIQLINFAVAAPATVTLQTLSYAGGVNAAGATVPAGGFDTVISLFNSSGALINENDDGPMSPIDPVTKQAFDVYLQTALAAGSYTVALGQFDNFANGPALSDGFTETDPAFTSLFGCSNGKFCDVTGANRTANWELDLINVSSASLPTSGVPEPGMTGLFGLGLAGLALAARRKLFSKL